jgi:hypothetical protein
VEGFKELIGFDWLRNKEKLWQKIKKEKVEVDFLYLDQNGEVVDSRNFSSSINDLEKVPVVNK